VSWKLAGLCPELLKNQPKTFRVDVMITIFCDFANFRRKKWRFSQKPML
jgi:hypothetical protein